MTSEITPGEIRPAIGQLEVDTTYLQLESGEIGNISFRHIDDQGRQISDIGSSVDCYTTNNATDPLMIKIYPECKVMGVFPGKKHIQARYLLSSGDELISPLIEIDVVPKQISLISGTYNFSFSEGQSQLWLSYSGLVSRDFYRATLRGLMPLFSSIQVVPSLENFLTVCRNTVPVNASKVACYFQADSNSAIIIVNNERSQPFQGQLIIEPDFQYGQGQVAVSFTEANAKQIYLNAPVSQYVFANEVGINRSHFYRYKPDGNISRSIKVTLADYDFPIQLQVRWGVTFCTPVVNRLNNQTTCTLTSGAGDVVIEIEGNNGVGLQNAPAAVEGGTKYTLTVESER